MIEVSARVATSLLLLLSATACGGDDDGGDDGREMTDSERDVEGGARKYDPQLPPADSDEIEGWLDQKLYEKWSCEEEPTAKTFGAPAIHAHGGKSRVCNNDLLAREEREGDAEFPKGVASVKELYNDAGKQVGSAVAVKIAAESAEGKGWYWWEGSAGSGVGAKACTGCHGAAGSDDDHPGAGDYVYFKN